MLTKPKKKLSLDEELSRRNPMLMGGQSAYQIAIAFEDKLTSFLAYMDKGLDEVTYRGETTVPVEEVKRVHKELKSIFRGYFYALKDTIEYENA